MGSRKNPLKRIRIWFTGWELQRGLLRRTPSLAQWEEGGEIRGKDWVLRPQENGEYYEAQDLFYHLGFRDTPGPFEIVFWAQGEAEALPLSINPRGIGKSSPPVEGKGGNREPQEEEVSKEKKVKRVRIGGYGSIAHEPLPNSSVPPERPKGKEKGGVPKSFQEVYERLLSLLGGEEFSSLGVNALLEFWGYNPEEVWGYLERKGVLQKRGEFYLLQEEERGIRRVVISDAESKEPSWLLSARVKTFGEPS